MTSSCTSPIQILNEPNDYMPFTPGEQASHLRASTNHSLSLQSILPSATERIMKKAIQKMPPGEAVSFL